MPIPLLLITTILSLEPAAASTECEVLLTSQVGSTTCPTYYVTASNTEYENCSIVVGGCATLVLDSTHRFRRLRIADSAKLVHTAGVAGMNIIVEEDFIVEPGAVVALNGRGHAQGLGPGAGASGQLCGGGAHGGPGGNHNSGGAGMPYGSPFEPVALGSGGGYDTDQNYEGGAGGGAIRVEAGGEIRIDGLVTANGMPHNGWESGGGAGGSVWLRGARIVGNGAVSANGGSASPPFRTFFGGTGGGGRIALEADSMELAETKITAYAGAGGSRGGSGTIWISELGSRRLVIDGGNQAARATFVTDEFPIDGDLVIRNLGRLGPPPQHAGLHLVVSGNVSIDAQSQITADGCGYPSGAGPGAGSTGQLCGGGGHGGAGGTHNFGGAGGVYGSSALPNTMGSGGGYDTDQNYVAGPGGGVIRISAGGVVVVDGAITANGFGYSGWESGGGAGGSVYIRANGISGAGLVSASGGAARPCCTTYFGGAGGGGRIALYSCTNVLSSTQMQVSGGGGRSPGKVGTLHLGNCTCDPDLTGDNLVDDVDFQTFAFAYNILECASLDMPPLCPSDLTRDGFVDDADFLLFAAAYDALLCPE